MRLFNVFPLALLFTLMSLSHAQIPQTMGYQGTLLDDTGQPVANGDYQMTFRIYDVSTGGTALWEETQTIAVTDGIFNAVLGSSTTLDLPFDQTYWLGVTVTDDPELDPRIELTSSAYSLNAHQVAGSTNFFPGDGNVGIGIRNPDVKFEVEGSWTLGITTAIPDGCQGRLYAPDGIISEAGGTDWAHCFNAFGGGDIARFTTGTLGNPSDIKLVIRNSGNVGVGISEPTDPLAVAGIISSTIGGFRFPDGTLQTTAAEGGTGDGNTLDQAYDQGGPGAGRTITADAGAFEVSGTDGILFEGTINEGTIPKEGEGVRMMWYPAEAAFRAGRLNASCSSYWDIDSIGTHSTAIGYNTRAKGGSSTAIGDRTTANGAYSAALGYNTKATATSSMAMGYGALASSPYAIAMGYLTTASGYNSTALGQSTTASGSYSTAMGFSTTASGSFSTCMGSCTKAEAYYSTALGSYNVGGGAQSTWVDTDPIFEIGIGTAEDNRDNAITVLKNGRVGIDIDEPQRRLHVNHLMRLEPIYTTPPDPSEGDIYMDGNTHKLMVYDGTQWQACW